MRPTDILRTEHEQLLRACAILENMAERFEQGTAVDSADATRIVDFVRFYADGLHHAKEEDVLFPALEAAGMPREGGPIGVMLREHERGREHVAGMFAALRALDSESGRASFAKSARGFAGLLEQHIAKENNVLFMMAERLLRPATEAALLDGYAMREASARAACGDKATHEATLAELSQRWL